MSNTITLMGVNTWYADHDPTSSETTNVGTISEYDYYINFITGQMWMNTDPTIDSLKWLSLDGVLDSGTAVLSLGSISVPSSAVTPSTPISLHYVAPGGTPGAVFVSAATPGTGFVITSTSSLDTSSVVWKVHSY